MKRLTCSPRLTSHTRTSSHAGTYACLPSNDELAVGEVMTPKACHQCFCKDYAGGPHTCVGPWRMYDLTMLLWKSGKAKVNENRLGMEILDEQVSRVVEAARRYI